MTPSTIEAPETTATDLQPDATDAMATGAPDTRIEDAPVQPAPMPELSEPTDYAPLSTQSMRSSRCNVGRTEQKFRLGAGAALLAAAAFAPLSRGWRIGLGALGAAELITGSMRYCPVSQALGINTCGPDER